MKKEQQYKAVFRTKIDFRNDDELFETLRPGGIYHLDNQQKVSYSDIADEAERVINIELKPELHKYTDMSIQKVQVQSVYEGSIEIIFTVVLGFLNLVGGLKDLYDVVYLVKEIAERHINKRLCASLEDTLE